MADNSVSACVEQRVVMKFLVNEGVKPVDIYRRLQAQYGDETLSHSKTSEWCKRFKDGRTSVSDDPGRGGSQPTAVISVNIQRVECLILDNRCITCREIAHETNLSVGTVNTIIHEHLHFRKVSARWVPRQLSAFDWHRRVEGCTELKVRFDREGQDFQGSHHYMRRNLGTSFHSGIKTSIKAVEACGFTSTKKNFEQLRPQVK